MTFNGTDVNGSDKLSLGLIPLLLSAGKVIDVAFSQQKGLDKRVNLALETVFEFDKNGKSDIQLLTNVQKLIGKVKDVIQRKNIKRREAGTDQGNIFTNFILNTINVLNKFEDHDLERFFAIVNKEIQRYCDKDDDIHIFNKLGLVRKMPAYVLRWYLKAITNKIEEEAYYEDEKAVIDGVNDIFKQDDTAKFDKFINNLEEYRRKTRRNLVQVIQLGLWNIFLDSYYHFKPTTKIALRSILHHYIDGFKSLATKDPVSKQPNTLKRAKSKTTKEPRTWRQMYVEKNLDFKYPYNYGPVTEKHERKDKTRTIKSRFMTVPTSRATKKNRQRKGKKYSKVIEYDISIDTSKHTDDSDEKSNSDDKTTIMKTPKRIVDNFDWKYNHNSRESKQSSLPNKKPVKIFVNRPKKRNRYKQKNNKKYYKREFYQKQSEQPSQYKTSKYHENDEDKYNAEHINVKKLSTFYLDFDKLKATTSYGPERFDTSTHEYERPVARPIVFSIDIKHGKDRNSRQKIKKSKHYGYIQKKRKDVFSNERQMRMKKKDLEMVRMQLSMAKESSNLDSGDGDKVQAVQNINKNEDARSTLSEEGLSIEGFPETKRKMYNRRSDNHNDTVNDHVLNRIQKLEQDLEAVKTKIYNVTNVKNENKFDNITKVTENKVNELKAGINIDKSGNQVINVRKFYEQRDRYDVGNKKPNLGRNKKVIKEKYSLETPDEEVTFNSTVVAKEKQNYNSARKAINDQKWYPVVRAREANSDEVVIQRKYAPLEITSTTQNEYDSKENSNVLNNEPLALDSLIINEATIKSLINDSNSMSSVDYLKEKVQFENLEDTTIITDSLNPKVLNKEAIENTLKDKTVDHKKGTVKDVQIVFKENNDKTLPKYGINVKLNVDNTINNNNTKKKVNKQNAMNEVNEIKDSPTFRSQIYGINKYDDVTLKKLKTIKNYIKTTYVRNYNSTETAVTVNNFITTQKVTDVASKADKNKKTDVKEIARRHIEIDNNNVTMVPKLDKLEQEMSTIDSTRVDGIKNYSPDKTSEVTKIQSSSNV